MQKPENDFSPTICVEKHGSVLENTGIREKGIVTEGNTEIVALFV